MDKGGFILFYGEVLICKPKQVKSVVQIFWLSFLDETYGVQCTVGLLLNYGGRIYGKLSSHS